LILGWYLSGMSFFAMRHLFQEAGLCRLMFR
jgi:hypothetical protein